jgi:hypothetical protein
MRLRGLAAAGYVLLLIPWQSLTAQRDTFRLAEVRLPQPPSVRARVRNAPSVRIRNTWGATELFGAEVLAAGFSYDSARGPGLNTQLAFAERYDIQVPGSAAGTGAVIGAVALGLPSAAGGVVIGGFECFDRPSPPCSATGTQVALGLLFGFGGAAVGGLLGHVVGSGISRWHVIWSWESAGREMGRQEARLRFGLAIPLGPSRAQQ